jgi:hypothetical protein
MVPPPWEHIRRRDGVEHVRVVAFPAFTVFLTVE